MTNFDRVEDGVIYLRISDSALNNKHWPIAQCLLQGGVVKRMITTQRGVHDLPDFFGWTTDMIEEWRNSSNYSSSFNGIEIYHDYSLGSFKLRGDKGFWS